MPQLAPIVLTTTAGISTFKPVNIDKNSVALFRDQATGIPVGYPLFSHSITEPAKNAASGVYRVKIQVAVPRLNVNNNPNDTLSLTSVEGTARGHIEFLLPIQAGKAERTQILELCKAALADATIVSTVENVEHYY